MEVQKRRRLVAWHTAAINDFVSNIKTAREFVNARIQGIPRPVARFLMDEYAKRYESTTAKAPVRAANIYLRKATDDIRAYLDKTVKFSFSMLHHREQLEAHAKDCAEHCEHILMQYSDDEATAFYEHNINTVYERFTQICEGKGVLPAFGSCETEIECKESGIIRMIRPEWWERRFSRLRDQVVEHVYVLAGFVRKGRQPYASNQTVLEWKRQQKANADYLQSMDLVNEETGERFNLAEIAKATTSNPKHRRTELMVRCRGLEDLADDMDYVSYFVTWTAPSKYHPNSKKYNGAQANHTHKYLCNQWAKARAAIKRAEIEWFGVRVAEPHADSCPHWHMLVFVHPDHKGLMQGILEGYATEHDKDELINRKGKYDIRPRFDIEEIDRSKGSATGYIAKYISKNVDGEGLDNQPDLETGDTTIDEGIARVTAWANRWRIRQFQFFGAAAVSVWRECRRIKNPVEDAAFEEIRKAADSAKWAEFTKLVKQNPVKLQYDKTKNEFNEVTAKIIGLFFGDHEIGTRETRYRLERREAQSDDSRASWSAVTNCTASPDREGKHKITGDDSLTRAVKNAGIDPFFVPILENGGRVFADDRLFVIQDNALRVYQ